MAYIKTDLIEKIEKKNTDPIHIMIGAEKTIASYPEDIIQIYTDGSAFKGTLHAGYGVRIEYPDRSCDELCNPCGAICSNYEAEATAIEAALHHLSGIFTIYPSKQRNVVIFSDCKSILQAVEHQDITTTTVKSLLLKINTFLETYAVNLNLQWIPGHHNIPGNERADELAKQEASNEQPNIPASLNTAKQIIRANKKEEWLNGWAMGSTGRCVFTHMPSPDPKDPINCL